VTTPKIGDYGRLVTQYWNTGPGGDFNPFRPIAFIQAQNTTQDTAQNREQSNPAAADNTRRSPHKVTRFADLVDETPAAQRSRYFSEYQSIPGNDNSTVFFITVDGQTPAVYDPAQPPNIIVHQGTVEDWTIWNKAQEDHVFHVHQLHFKVLAINGQPVDDPAVRDTIDLPYWSGTGPYPSVTLRLDFRDSAIVGMFLYHCHILAHEDAGMMGSIEVLPPSGTTTHPNR
jgi:FtsP/CotA-like multicopper oxidase with cupredoxin domain